jgi:MFS family permease
MAFAVFMLGQLMFGFLVDRWSRKNALLLTTGTILLIIFAAGSYGPGDRPHWHVHSLIAFRFSFYIFFLFF